MVSIIIPSFSRTQILYKSLEQIREFIDALNGEIIVVDDNKDKPITLPFLHHKLRLLKNPGSGVASARNYGAKYANYDRLIFMDDDMIITQHALSVVTDFLNENPGACMNLSWTYPPELQKQISTTKFGRYLLKNGHADLKGWMDNEPWHENSIYQVNGITSQFLALHKQDFDKIGGYNENFPHAGFEDRDFSLRLTGSGVKVWLNTKVQVYHNEEDRVSMDPWLARRYRNGFTLAIGVKKFGYTDYTLNYSGFKSLLFNIIYTISPLYKLNLFLLPNIKLFDSLYSFFFNPLLGAFIHKGYKMGLKDA